jgi:uncharacterized cofD-like protein
MLTRTEEAIVQFAKNPAAGLRIAAIGGGTGLATLLRGLKLFSDNLTAIVTVADNGGSSGMLREDLGILPPGDIRNCILALADAEPLMSDLLNFRFREGRLRGQNFGNLLIAAMNAVSGNFCDAVRNVSKVLAVKGQVLPVSLTDIQIAARLQDGSIIRGETEIGHRHVAADQTIVEVSMDPPDAPALPEAVEALQMADVIVLGPGSLYTSIIPNLLFPEINAAIRSSRAVRVYVCNIMTQPAETLGYDAAHHLRAILDHAGLPDARGYLDYCIINNAWIEQKLIDRYQLESAVPVLCDRTAVESLGIAAVESPLACVNNGLIRHDHMILARMILSLALEKAGPAGADRRQAAGAPAAAGKIRA